MAEKPVRDVASSRPICAAAMDRPPHDPAAWGPDSRWTTILPQISGNEAKKQEKYVDF
jgi:hypothetical protein